MREFTVTPDRYCELIFFCDPPFVREAHGLERLPKCTLIPLLDRPLKLELHADVRCAAIRLHAWSAGIVTPLANADTHMWSDAAALFGEKLDAIDDALRRGAWFELTPIFDRVLFQIFGNARFGERGEDAARTLLALPDEGLEKSSQNVAAELGYSRRQLERRVRSLTNRSPKTLANVARFQFARDTLWSEPEISLDRLASAAGYADQAHLSRDFRRFAAQSPSAFRRDCVQLKVALLATDVAFVQDDGPDDGYTKGP